MDQVRQKGITDNNCYIIARKVSTTGIAYCSDVVQLRNENTITQLA